MSALQNTSKVIEMKLTGYFIYYNILCAGFNRWSNVIYCILLDLLCGYLSRLIVNWKAAKANA